MTIEEARIELATDLQVIYDQREASNISEWVIEWLTETKKSDRLIHRNKELASNQKDELEMMKRRLLEHEPVQYVLGEVWFCGFKFYVNKAVLIPRPETEELVEWIISNCRFPLSNLDILDIGSGSGCIAISLKRKLRKCKVWSCDISEAAIEVATRNAVNLGVAIEFNQINFLDKKQQESLGSFDIIVSNPPYVPQKDRDQLRQNVLNFEPSTALFVPDNDPAVFYRAIAEFGKTHLNKEGSIYVEIPENKGVLMTDVFQSAGYRTELRKDMQGKDRMIKAS